MFMRTDLLPSILISEFYIQLASSFHMKCTVCRNNILLGELQFFNLQSIAPRLHSVYMLPDYSQSTCTQATCSLHPLESTTQPTRKLSSWRICTFYKKKLEQHSAQPGQEFYQQKSKCYRHLMGQFEFYVYRNYRHSSIGQMLQRSSLHIQRKGDVAISTKLTRKLFLEILPCDRNASLSPSSV